MGKRSSFPRVDRDFYRTPEHAVVPLLAHLSEGTLYHEPCAGEGDLVAHLIKHGHECRWAGDIMVRNEDAIKLDYCAGECFITNPPYRWQTLAPIMFNLYKIAPTWLLLPADMMHNQRMALHMMSCIKVVSVGRVKWFNNKSGMENSAWYLFDICHTGTTEFYGRTEAL